MIEPLPAQAKIPRKQIQHEFANEPSYSKSRLGAKAPVARNLKKNPSVANLKMSTNPNNIEEIIPRLAGFPMQGRTIQVAGHDDSQIFNKQNNRVKPQSHSVAETI